MPSQPHIRPKEVDLNPALNERLRAEVRAEQAAKRRGKLLRRYVALPLALGATFGSAVLALYGDGFASLAGNLLASALVYFFWKIRRRLPAVFGFV